MNRKSQSIGNGLLKPRNGLYMPCNGLSSFKVAPYPTGVNLKDNVIALKENIIGPDPAVMGGMSPAYTSQSGRDD
ncbi:hypothetical protein [Parapedobacter sp. 2B3]|uniref:hypothetical protein n=1 Tax=Parapedobacter sp. 2B3 TaxID=3342381 RepID=UPI0035B5B304